MALSKEQGKLTPRDQPDGRLKPFARAQGGRGKAARAGKDAQLGVGADVVLECSGVPALLQTAADLARTGGLVGLISFLAQPATINGARWLAKELSLVASNAFTHDDFRRSMAFLADGRVVDELRDPTRESVLEAMTSMAQPAVAAAEEG